MEGGVSMQGLMKLNGGSTDPEKRSEQVETYQTMEVETFSTDLTGSGASFIGSFVFTVVVEFRGVVKFFL